MENIKNSLYFNKTNGANKIGEGGMNYFALGSFWRFKMLVYSLICNSISVLQARYNSIPHVDTGGIR